MSGDSADKTHKPTPKRMSEFRKRGEIALSKDLTSVAVMVGGIVGALLFSETSVGAVSDLVKESAGSLDGRSTDHMFDVGLATFITAVLPVFIGGFVGFILATVLQLGWPPALKAPTFDPLKPFKLDAIKGMLSPKSMGGRALKSTAKVAVVLFIMSMAILLEYEDFLENPAMSSEQVWDRMAGAVQRMALYAVSALAALAILDYGYQKYSMMQKMKMSSEEIKQEHKNQEGDPQIKSKRRSKMRELSGRRMAVEVRKADVIVVNPTHYAVALRYSESEDGAPRVLAKGKAAKAERIRALARAAGIPILSRPPLTRLIYRVVPEGAEIPPKLYQAVAEILAYVYSLRRRAA